MAGHGHARARVGRGARARRRGHRGSPADAPDAVATVVDAPDAPNARAMPVPNPHPKHARPLCSPTRSAAAAPAPPAPQPRLPRARRSVPITVTVSPAPPCRLAPPPLSRRPFARDLSVPPCLVRAQALAASIPRLRRPAAMAGLLWLPSGVVFLSEIILSIPLAFDVGGRDCGLTYSLALAVFYFLLSTARLAAWRPVRPLLRSVELLQYIVVIPGLLIYALSKFSDDVDDDGGGPGGGLAMSIRTDDRTWVEQATIGPWEAFLMLSTPMFQLAEGFCSLLVIQAFGQISRWLVNRNKSDTWMVSDMDNNTQALTD